MSIYPVSPRLSPTGTHYICDHCGRKWLAATPSRCHECNLAFDIIHIKGIIARFTVEKPLVVNFSMYKQLERLGVVPNEKVIIQQKVPGEWL